ncbi:hypothetical protein OC844_004045 [Tilletia horrida]|nr:hypothetical protein OC844_004045 [Tilletia horrida]
MEEGIEGWTSTQPSPPLSTAATKPVQHLRLTPTSRSTGAGQPAACAQEDQGGQGLWRRDQRSKHHGGAGASAVLRFLGVTELVKMTFEDEALDRVDLLAIAAVCKQLSRDIPVTRARELLRLFQHNEHMTSHVKYFRLRNDKAEHGDGATAQSSRHGTFAQHQGQLLLFSTSSPSS